MGMLLVLLASLASAADLRAVAVTYGPAPGGGTYQLIRSAASIDEDGRIAFVDSDGSVYVDSFGVVATVLKSGPVSGLGTSVAADELTFPPLFADGRMVFRASIDGTQALLSWDSEGGLEELVRVGDTDGTATIDGFSSTSLRMVADGTVYFETQLGGSVSWFVDPDGTFGRVLAPGGTLGSDTILAVGPVSVAPDESKAIAVTTTNAVNPNVLLLWTSPGWQPIWPTGFGGDDHWNGSIVGVGGNDTTFIDGEHEQFDPYVSTNGLWGDVEDSDVDLLFELPTVIDGHTVTTVQAAVAVEGVNAIGHPAFVAEIVTDSADAWLLYDTQSGHDVFAVDGSAVPDRTDMTMSVRNAAYQGGDVVLLEGYCTTPSLGSNCRAVWRYDRITRGLTTVAATGDTLDLAGAGSATITAEVLFEAIPRGTGPNVVNLDGDFVIFARTSLGYAVLTTVPAQAPPDVAVTLTGEQVSDAAPEFTVEAVVNNDSLVAVQDVELQVQSDLMLYGVQGTTCTETADTYGYACPVGPIPAGGTVIARWDGVIAPGSPQPFVVEVVAVVAGDSNPANNTASISLDFDPEGQDDDPDDESGGSGERGCKGDSSLVFLLPFALLRRSARRARPLGG